MMEYLFNNKIIKNTYILLFLLMILSDLSSSEEREISPESHSVWTIEGFLEEFARKRTSRKKEMLSELIEIGVINNDNSGSLFIFDLVAKEVRIITKNGDRVREKSINFDDNKSKLIGGRLHQVIKSFPKMPVSALEAATISSTSPKTIWLLRFLDVNGGGTEMVVAETPDEFNDPALIKEPRSTEKLEADFERLRLLLQDK